MSEQILKALMQLFAIIARPDSNGDDRRTVVRSFLSRQLNQELVEEYLKVFDDYYAIHQQRQQEKEKRRRRISSSSVRVLKICTEINEELILEQKIVVLVQLLEFVKSENNEINRQEHEFIKTVSDTFLIESKDFKNLQNFVLFPFDKLPQTESILVVDSNQQFKNPKVKHIYSEFLSGQIRVLYIQPANMYLFRYMGYNEMYLNGQLLQQDKIYVFNTGSSIRNPQIKPIYYSDIVSSFHKDMLKSRIVFEALDISYTFRNGNTGLHEMGFTEESGRLIGIMGASGSGKSTLLNVLNGSAVPDTGEVLINGINIHTEAGKVEGLIGHVSQDDLLIEELTVYQNLYYNAKLCFDQYSSQELEDTVSNMLNSLGLSEIRDIQVGSPLNKKISGGQRKRLNIALELIREPAILFLDEPTSGLSSRDSENIMDLLKELSLKGKLVFVVIHQPSSEIFKMFDSLIILDTGGYMIYKGDPIESILYFKSRIHHANYNESECHACGNVNPEQIFNIVESNVLDEYGKLTRTRKITPREWYMYFKNFMAGQEKQEPIPPEKLPDISFNIPGWFKQFGVFVKRDVLSKLSNTQYLIINFLEAPVLAFILSFIIKYYNVNVTNEFGYTLSKNSNLPVYIFMAVIVAIFVGLTVSAEEIIKDRKILKREAFLNLSWSGYLASKIAVLFFISAIQALTFVIIGNSILQIRGMYFHYWLVLFSAWASANMMGLLISDSFKTVVTIYILIPFLVIPQIILSGIIVKYEKLNPSISSPGKIPVYGEVITARWGYEALAVYQFMENDYEKKLYPYNKIMSIAEFKKNYWIPNLRNKVDYVKRHFNDAPVPENKKTGERLLVLRNEIGRELNYNSNFTFGYINMLYPEKVTEEILDSTRHYIDALNHFYIRVYNKANRERDNIISSLQKTPEAKQEFLRLKRTSNNERLEEFVTNSGETDRIVEYEGRLFQKIDPIYMDPEGKFIKAHFYAPHKKLFGHYYPTYWVNIGVIWLMTIMLYIALHFRLLRKLIDRSNRWGEKRSMISS